MDVLGGLTKSSVDGEYDRLDVEDQLTDLRLLTSYLENELNVVRQENADFRRDMMTSALRNHATLAADDVSRLMEKIVELMNGTVARRSLTKHSAVGLPRRKTPANPDSFYFFCFFLLCFQSDSIIEDPYRFLNANSHDALK